MSISETSCREAQHRAAVAEEECRALRVQLQQERQVHYTQLTEAYSLLEGEESEDEDAVKQLMSKNENGTLLQEPATQSMLTSQ